MIAFGGKSFPITVEVVPPGGPDAGPLLSSLEAVKQLPFYGYSVASNPVAKPYMDALAFSALLQRRTGKPLVLHCTTRDHNYLSLQGLLWGARAMGVETVLAATGDLIALQRERKMTTVRDLDVFALVRLAREAGFQTGVVLDPRFEAGSLEKELDRLRRKIAAGAQFAVTQPLYDERTAGLLAKRTRNVGVPVMMGILPLRSTRHAAFLQEKVAGIAVPENICRRLREAGDPLKEGLEAAAEMLSLARTHFAGACIMPTVGNFQILYRLLETS